MGQRQFLRCVQNKNTVKNLSDWGIPGTRKIVISPGRNGEFGSSEYAVPLSDAKQLTATYDKAVYTIIGTADKMKDGYFDSFYSNMIQPLDKKNMTWRICRYISV